MRFRSLLFSAAVLASPAALAQPQAADVQAARELFKDGFTLQQAGKFPEALDKFQRSYDTYGAPTTALHIAQCQAAMLRLVEAAETYRGVARVEADPAKPEFQQAKDQATAELAQVEPRIPHLTIKVTPASAQGLVVTLDGQVVKPALVGVPRPTNPGVHRITAVASSYQKAEQTIELKERTPLTVPIALQPGGVVYTPTGPGPSGPTGPGPVPTGPTGPGPGPGGGAPGGGGTGVAPSGGAGAPPGGGSGQWQGNFQTEWQVGARRYSRMSLLFGGHVEAMVPAGDAVQNVSFSDAVGVGFGGGGEIAFRFARYFLVGGTVGGGGFGNGKSSASGASTYWVGPYLGYIGNPEGFGFYGEIGGAFRGVTSGGKLEGGEFLLGLGFHIRAGAYVRLVPKAQMFVGTFSNSDSGSITNTAPHVVFNFGLTGFFDLDLDKPEKPPAAPGAPAPAGGASY